MVNKASDRYFVNPVWGNPIASRGGSGTSMEVVLGPEAILSTNYGSKTGATSIPVCMGPLNKKDYLVKSGKQTGLWVAGHLLNDNLGGLGTDSSNLTPLTQTANKNHATYEGYIKDILTVAERLKRFDKNAPVLFGVKYRVVVHDSFGTTKPYSLAPSHITISAEIYKASKADGTVSAAVAGDYAGLSKSDQAYFAKTFSAVEIHNADEHLTGCDNPGCDHDVDMG